MKTRRFFIENMQLHHETPDGNPDWLRGPVAAYNGWVTVDELVVQPADTPEEFALALCEDKLRALQDVEFHNGYYGVVSYYTIREESGADVMRRIGNPHLLPVMPLVINFHLSGEGAAAL
jgi:hypothetical protein